MKTAKYSMLLAAGMAIVLLAGCSMVAINERAISVDDVIRMTEADVGSDVIIRQIEVTRTRFELTPNEIIQLKKAGVEDKVLEVMVETEGYPQYYGDEFGYDPYNYSFQYYNNWYPVASHYPYIYHYMYPYTSYRRADMVGRFYRYAPIQSPPYRIYDRQRYDWMYPERRGNNEDEE